MVSKKKRKVKLSKRVIKVCLRQSDSPPVADPLRANHAVSGEGGWWWWRWVGRWRAHCSHLLPGCWYKELLPSARPRLL